jgi:hypothetical protein
MMVKKKKGLKKIVSNFLFKKNSTSENKFDSFLLSIREHLAKAVRKLASYKHELLLTQLFVFAAKSEKQIQGEFAKAMQSRCQIIDYIERNAQAVIDLVTQAMISRNTSALALTVEVGDTVSPYHRSWYLMTVSNKL